MFHTIMLALTLVSTLVVPAQVEMAEDGGAGDDLARNDRKGKGLAWHSGTLEEAIADAGTTGRHLLVVLSTETSQHCALFLSESFEPEEARAALEPFALFKADVASATGATLVGRFGVTLLPSVAVLSPAGEAQEMLPGYRPQSRFAAELSNVLNGVGTVGALEGQVSSAPEDPDLRLKLAMKLRNVGRVEEGLVQLEEIRRLDPTGESEAGARLAIDAAVKEARSGVTDPSDLAAYDLSPVRALLDRIQQPAVLHQGWRWVASVEEAKGDFPAARRALTLAYPHRPVADSMLWLTQTARAFWMAGEQLTSAERRTALEMAQAAVDLAEKALPSTIEEERGEIIDSFAVLASCHELNGDKEKALDVIERALKLAPDSEELLRIAGSLSSK